MSSTMPMRPAEHSDGDRSMQTCARTAERRVLARVRGAPQSDSQRFPTICCWSASTNIRWACLGRRYGPRRRRAPPWPSAPRCRATAERVRRGAPRPDSQRFPTIFRRSASINIRWACVGRGYGLERLRVLYLPSGSLVQSHPISFPSLILSNPVIVASRTVIDGESSWT